MLRASTRLTILGVALLSANAVKAQTALLLVASDPTQISEVQLAKVMANDSSLWLSVRLKGPARLAVVTSQAGVEQAPAAEAWLRALDFATRVRVAAPRDAHAGCSPTGDFQLVDSGLPERVSIAPTQRSSLDSELELRRALLDARLTVDPSRLLRFARDAALPFDFSLYPSEAGGGSTLALRIIEHGHPDELPQIAVSGLDSVPLSLIALAQGGVQPAAQDSADPSEFPIAYRASSASTDYVAARATWLIADSARWLVESEASSALFAWTVFPGQGQIAPAVTRYFQSLSGARASACEASVRAALARGSVETNDFVCDGADDLALSLREVGFAVPRLSRLFGSLGAQGAAFRVAPGASQSPLLQATDLDTEDCPPLVPASPVDFGAGTGSVGAPPAEVSAPPVVSSQTPASNSAAASGDSGCQATATDSGQSDSCSASSTPGDGASNGSCSGDSSSQGTAADSCSGNSSSDSTSSDSCSGNSDSSSDSTSSDGCSGNSDSSSDSTSSDGCSGNSDSKSSDSSGCGKSEYDGDTCSGSSQKGATGAGAGKSSATLRSGNASRRHPGRQVRLSLLTLLAAALALPLRRLERKAAVTQRDRRPLEG